MTVWLAIAVVLIAVALGISGCVAYIVISLSRTAPLLGTRLGLADVQVIKVTSQPQRRARPHRAQLRVRAAVLQA
jgi:uncharacterized membrane protein